MAKSTRGCPLLPNLPTSGVDIELITTGSELLLGRVLNTHQQWLGTQLDAHGWTLTRQVTIPDTAPAIEGAVREALERATLIITTGGLGPTADDITRGRIAALLGLPLREDPSVREHITTIFQRIRRPMPESVFAQAQVPQGATILQNARGTAPGLFLKYQNTHLLMLPGPPRELRPMFTSQALPLLREHCPPASPATTRILKIAGMGESLVEEKVSPPLSELAGLDIGYCARNGEVDLRLRASDPTLIDQAETLVRKTIGPFIFGVDDDTLEQHIIERLTQRGETLALAESCTGGHLANRLTNIPGASAVLHAGHVTYSNTAKQTILGVEGDTLSEHGAVSQPTARAMAEGARGLHGTTYALATTGIAGPGGGTKDKPVGTVHIALTTPTETHAIQRHNPVDRATFKFVATQQALDLLRTHLPKPKSQPRA
ncbi:MAG: competence/damage-inducible protein A [Verrucomicrobiales bacterium]|nr:competence/damage-inducible protein A [Verrucomicrobiales bacterium]